MKKRFSFIQSIFGKKDETDEEDTKQYGTQEDSEQEQQSQKQEENGTQEQEDKLVTSNHLENIYYFFYNNITTIDEQFSNITSDSYLSSKKEFFLNLINLRRCVYDYEINVETRIIELISSIIDNFKYTKENEQLKSFIFKIYSYIYDNKKINYKDGVFKSIVREEFDKYLHECLNEFKNQHIGGEFAKYDEDVIIDQIKESFEELCDSIRSYLPEPIITRFSKIRNQNGINANEMKFYVFDLEPSKFFYFDDGHQNQLLNAIGNKNANDEELSHPNQKQTNGWTGKPKKTTKKNVEYDEDFQEDDEDYEDEENDEEILDEHYSREGVSGTAKNQGKWDENESIRLAKGLFVFDKQWIKIERHFLGGMRSAQQIKDKLKGKDPNELINEYLTNEDERRVLQRIKEMENYPFARGTKRNTINQRNRRERLKMEKGNETKTKDNKKRDQQEKDETYNLQNDSDDEQPIDKDEEIRSQQQQQQQQEEEEEIEIIISDNEKRNINKNKEMDNEEQKQRQQQQQQQQEEEEDQEEEEEIHQDLEFESEEDQEDSEEIKHNSKRSLSNKSEKVHKGTNDRKNSSKSSPKKKSKKSHNKN